MVIEGRKKKDFSQKILAETVLTMLLIYDEEVDIPKFEEHFGICRRTFRRYINDIRETGYPPEIIFHGDEITVDNWKSWWFWDSFLTKSKDAHIMRLNRIINILCWFLDAFNGYVKFDKECSWYGRYYDYHGDDEEYLYEYGDDDEIEYDDEGNLLTPVTFPLEPIRVTPKRARKALHGRSENMDTGLRSYGRDIKVIEAAIEVYRENFL